MFHIGNLADRSTIGCNTFWCYVGGDVVQIVPVKLSFAMPFLSEQHSCI